MIQLSVENRQLQEEISLGAQDVTQGAHVHYALPGLYCQHPLGCLYSKWILHFMKCSGQK